MMEAGVNQQRSYVQDLASLILLVAAISVVFGVTRFTAVDDAYISFRYAHNLAFTGELVFNAGERVEGITNLLWTLILAAQAALLKLPLDSFALFASLALVAFSALRLWQLGPLLGSTHVVGAVSALLLVLNPYFIHTATNGLEAGLYAALQAETIYRYCRNQLKMAYLFAGLLFVTRPEGVVLCLLLVCVVFLRSRSTREAGVGIAIVGGMVALVTAFRIFYYGSAVPNSVIAKLFELGLVLQRREALFSYFQGFLGTYPYLVIILIGALGGIVQSRSLRDKASLVFLFCVGGILWSFIVVIRNGGDWMPGHRLCLQYGILYAVALISLSERRLIRTWAVVALALLPLLQTTRALAERGNNDLFSFYYVNMKGGFWVETSKRLAGVVEDSDTVSAEGLGYISYHLIHNRFYDPSGLTDPYLARHGQPSPTYGKHDSTYIIGKLQPAVMVWQSAWHVKEVDRELLDMYTAFCASDCDNWNANLVMIHGRRLRDLAPAFADWEKVEIQPDSIL
jgi:hypothetical protein